MESSLWTYNAVELKSASTPATSELIDIRNRAIQILIKLYKLNITEKAKSEIIKTFNIGTRIPHRHCDDKLLTNILQNSRIIIDFYITFLPSESFEILNIIEEDVLSLHQSANHFIKSDQYSEDVRTQSALLIKSSTQFKNILNANEEFVIYKTLVGYKSVFLEDWDDNLKSYEEKNEQRKEKIAGYTKLMNKKNFEQWQERILRCAQTKFDDYADSIYFRHFLELLAQNNSESILTLTKEHHTTISNCLTTILDGLLHSKLKNQASSLIKQWIIKNQYLYELARIFRINRDADIKLLNKIFTKAKALNDISTLTQIIPAALNYYDINPLTAKKLFINTLKELTANHSTLWTRDFWYQQYKPISATLTVSETDIFLQNLLLVDYVDFHIEQILIPIAEKTPEKVIEFFGKRITTSNRKKDRRNYEAIPFQFYELNKPLSEVPNEAVDIISKWYKEEDRLMFVFHGAKLLKNIFPDFSKPFEEKLLEFLTNRKERNLQIVMAILKNYEGEIFLHKICKELIKALPENDKRLIEIEIILMSTGVVRGEFGFAEAYEQKKQEVADWLQDQHEQIRNFADRYLKDLDLRIAQETRRAKESIELRKHQFGSNDD
jgi:hypothetical protein